MMSFMTGDFFVQKLHGLSLAREDSLVGWYTALSLLLFSALMYLLQNNPLRFWKNRFVYAFFGVVATSLSVFLFLVLGR